MYRLLKKEGHPFNPIFTSADFASLEEAQAQAKISREHFNKGTIFVSLEDLEAAIAIEDESASRAAVRALPDLDER